MTFPFVHALSQALAASIAAQSESAQADLATIPPQLAELSRRFVALDRQLPAAARRLEELRALPPLGEFARAEADRLQAVSGVSSMQIVGSAILVLTEPITVPWNGRLYNLGAYRLVLDLDGDVRIESQDHLGPRSHWDHPHVQNALPCLGNLREGILKLLAEYELALAARVLLDFLGTYLPESAYTPIEGWPQANLR